MKWLRSLVWLLLPCRHRDRDGVSLTYRERRGPDRVLHLVCERCGRATPAIDRSADELKKPARIGPAHERMRARKAHRPENQVLPFDKGRRS